MSTILIAEDDQQIREALDRILRFEGYETVLAKDGAAALEAFDQHAPDAALLDVMMPFVDGLSVVRKLRDRGNRTPILMLTARQETPDRVAGLDAGADDYLAKPFELDELLARVRALLRRTDHSDSVTLTCGDLLVDPAKRLVTRDGDTIELTRTEFDILHTLITNAEIVMSRSQLYETIWGYDFETNSKSLDVHIGYLRRKLEAGDRARLVHTVRGIGYVVRAGDSS
ncbi:MAG: response regulator transcription factor [Ilumatobacter sp.]|jgi:two-component system response regulator MprA|uniref:response regulator transcription factor n=1 Tax=Ilumatobacter sp. TaxID=1967498 RepID=UPI001E13AF3B|nr:response regulator transcription factor [Ilumatobacter sp.]MBT5277610.1 response regulator transcription factor [Ilumatobacter sp.]MBT5553771.1 response regulator transcription factor [Ilumatobacter sp.]MBT5863978.1 response regulator transcription factor [Ilumatobacter sp.]MDG1393143.1 response regulator transcription factor [Ilumatobacter sp.]